MAGGIQRSESDLSLGLSTLHSTVGVSMFIVSHDSSARNDTK